MKKVKLKTPDQNENSSKELDKGLDHVIVEIVEYIDNAVMSRTILKKITGNVTAMSFSEGEELSEKTIPFDTYIQIIDGTADITIEKTTHHLEHGSGIVIPAHTVHRFNASQKFKMISTMIKSGYEEVA